MESTGTEGDEKIGSVREAFEPRRREGRGSERKKKQQWRQDKGKTGGADRQQERQDHQRRRDKGQAESGKQTSLKELIKTVRQRHRESEAR